MGCNRDYTVFEATTIGAYDLGKLDKDLLGVILRPYSGSDIDSGGCMNLHTRDGKGVQQVVIETYGMKYPKEPERKQFDKIDEFNDALDDWSDEVYCLFRKVTQAYGWD